MLKQKLRGIKLALFFLVVAVILFGCISQPQPIKNVNNLQNKPKMPVKSSSADKDSQPAGQNAADEYYSILEKYANSEYIQVIQTISGPSAIEIAAKGIDNKVLSKISDNNGALTVRYYNDDGEQTIQQHLLPQGSIKAVYKKGKKTREDSFGGLEDGGVRISDYSMESEWRCGKSFGKNSCRKEEIGYKALIRTIYPKHTPTITFYSNIISRMTADRFPPYLQKEHRSNRDFILYGGGIGTPIFSAQSRKIFGIQTKCFTYGGTLNCLDPDNGALMYSQSGITQDDIDYTLKNDKVSSTISVKAGSGGDVLIVSKYQKEGVPDSVFQPPYPEIRE